MLLTAIFAFISLNVLVLLLATVAHSMRRFQGVRLEDLLGNGLIAIAVQIALYLLVVGFMVQIVRVRHETPLMGALSWNPPDRKTAAVALCGGLGLAMSSLILSSLLARWTPTSLPIERFFRETSSAYVVSLFAVLVAPVVEELFFRGFLYPALARRTGVTGAIWLTALAFTLLHGAQLGYAWAPLVPIFVVGLVLTTVRAASKSLALCVLVHMAYNSTLLGVDLILTHGFRRLPHV